MGNAGPLLLGRRVGLESNALLRVGSAPTISLVRFPMALILLQQTITMLVLMAVGLGLTRTGMFDEAFTKRLGNFLLTVIVPCITIRGFLDPPEGAELSTMLGSLGISAVVMGIAGVVGFAIYGRKRNLDAFAVSFSNAGFFGIPLVTSLYGDAAMFYMAGLLAVFNAEMFTYGQWLLTGDPTTMKPRSIITNPVVIAAVAGCLVFALHVPVPPMVEGALDALANCNTALAMLILGSYLAKLSPRDFVSDPRSYLVMAVRLLLVPAVTILVFRLVGWSLDPLPASILIGGCAPVGANIAILAQQHDMDYEHAIKLVCISTILSCVTLPLMFQLATMMLPA